jgi:DNA-binding NarL/FixJ family response regulator
MKKIIVVTVQESGDEHVVHVSQRDSKVYYTKSIKSNTCDTAIKAVASNFITKTIDRILNS